MEDANGAQQLSNPGVLLHSGSLEKRGMSMVQNWKVRSFQLFETRLVYYKESDEGQEGAHAKGTFKIDHETDFGHSKLRPFCFYIKSLNLSISPPAVQKLHMRATSAEELEDWIAAVRVAVMARKELNAVAPRETLLAEDFRSNSSRFTDTATDTDDNPSAVAMIQDYREKSREWKMEKESALNTKPRLSITIRSTVGVVLKNKKSALLPDPYCVVSVGSTVVQTRTVHQTLNPTWDESFTFDFNRSLRYATVEVWDGSSHAKPTFMGHAFIPLFHMAAGANHRKMYSLGKRSHKSHVSGQIVMDVYTDFKQHDLSIKLFKQITAIQGFKKDLCGPPIDHGRLGGEALKIIEKAIMGEEKGTERKETAVEMTDEGVQTSQEDVPIWEERFDETQGFPYYFNTVTLVSQWEKPPDFAADQQAPRSRKESQPPIMPHPSLSEVPEEDVEGAKDIEVKKREVPLSVAERAEAEKKEKEKAENEAKKARRSRRQSKLIKLGSSLRMTLTWGKTAEKSEKGDEESTTEGEGAEQTRDTNPFPSTMPPSETERLEDMTWRVILHSPPDVTNGIHIMGVLILTNYRLLFVPETTLLTELDPANHPKGEFTLTIEVPIMMIGQASVIQNRDLLIKTKDAHEFWFRLAENHRSETEEELMEMELERNRSGTRLTDAGMDVKPKKRNQMNTGIKGLRLAVKSKGAASMATSFMNMTGIKQVAHSVADKLSRLTTNDTNDKKNKETEKVKGLLLGLNGRTPLESYLLGWEGLEGGKKKNKSVIAKGIAETAPPVQPSLFSKKKWSENDLEIAQGVLSDDGSGIRRFAARIKYRVFNAQFETKNWLQIHQQLCTSLNMAAAELAMAKEDTETKGEEEKVEIRISAYNYVDDRETGFAHDDVSFHVPKSWITDTQRAIQEGHEVYNIKKEYERMGVPNSKWRISMVNEEFGICSTYPNVWAVPSSVSDKQLEKAAKHRSKGRLPVLTWRHPTTHATITRCSQPMVGLAGNRNAEDENLVSEINKVSGQPIANLASRPFVIIDARPKVNAQVNQAAGKGYESGKAYVNSELIFMNIGNIHTMRKSVENLGEACCNRSHDGSSWLQALDSTQWLYHCHKVLRASVHVSHLISRRGISCLVHCSDGWDRTAQICALSELIMDPYYRTIKGFQVLVEKDWLSFGHKFADRNGFHKNGGHHSQERSPIFIQFLDCVHQMVCQHPTRFEFNDRFLVEMSRQSHMGWFGNFLYNTMKERRDNGVKDSTISLWTFVDNNLTLFSNPGFISHPGTIKVDASPKKMVLWSSWFMKWHDLEYEILWGQEGEEVHVSGGKRGSAIARRGDSEAGGGGVDIDGGGGLVEGERALAQRRRSSANAGLEGLEDEGLEDEVPSDVEEEEDSGGEEEGDGAFVVGSFIPPPTEGPDSDADSYDEDAPPPPPPLPK